jgi:hypothetical protein
MEELWWGMWWLGADRDSPTQPDTGNMPNQLLWGRQRIPLIY